jgi:hypothetical protein
MHCRIVIPDWRPPSKNELMRRTIKNRIRLQSKCTDMIIGNSIAQHVPRADGFRAVSLGVCYRKGRRFHDVDAFWMAVLDGLASARMIVDDSYRWCGIHPVEYGYGRPRTIILLDDYRDREEWLRLTFK